MAGRDQGFCVYTRSKESPNQIKDVVGLQTAPIGHKVKNFENAGKEVINMPFGDGTGPAGMGPMTGRAAGFCAGYSVPGYMNHVGSKAGFYGTAVPRFGPHGAGAYGFGAGYGVPYVGYGNPWLGRGFGFGRGFGRGRGWGRGRGGGRFGYW